MRVCESVWDVATADRVQELMVAGGIPSPCESGGRCPFVPSPSESEAAQASQVMAGTT